MNLKSICLLALCYYTTFAAAAPMPYSLPSSTSTPDTGKPKSMFSNSNLGFLYGYTDFHFDSTKSGNFNRFDGHSNLYGVGGDNVNITLFKDLTAGLFIYKADTKVNSNILLSPGFPTTANQTNHNYTLFGHLLKGLNKNFFIDVAGAYGQNKLSSETKLFTGTQTQLGFSKSNSTNWFTSLTGIYTRPWKKFVLSANARALYSEINAESYVLQYQTSFPAQTVLPLTNKSFFTMENAEIGYKFKPKVTPFINAGLIQVVHYSNSRPLVTAAINGAIPQLNMDKNGYKLGGGIGFGYKKWAFRVEEQYYTAGGTFRSYQTLVGAKYVI